MAQPVEPTTPRSSIDLLNQTLHELATEVSERSQPHLAVGSETYSLFSNFSAGGSRLIQTQSSYYELNNPWFPSFATQFGIRIDIPKPRFNIHVDLGAEYRFIKASKAIEVHVNGADPTGDRYEARQTQHSFYPLIEGEMQFKHPSFVIGLYIYPIGVYHLDISPESTTDQDIVDNLGLNGNHLSIGGGARVGYTFNTGWGAIIPFVGAGAVFNVASAATSGDVRIYGGVEIAARINEKDPPSPQTEGSKGLSELQTSLNRERSDIQTEFDRLTTDISKFDQDLKTLDVKDWADALDKMIDRHANIYHRIANEYLRIFKWLIKAEEALAEQSETFKVPNSEKLERISRQLLDQLTSLQNTIDQSLGSDLPYIFGPNLESKYGNQKLNNLDLHLKAHQAVRDFYAVYINYLKISKSDPDEATLRGSLTRVRTASENAERLVKANNKIYQSSKHPEFVIQLYNPFLRAK